MPGWAQNLELELQPETPQKAKWNGKTPYRRPVVLERKGIEVTNGILDLKFNFNALSHVAATELIQESVADGEVLGIPDWPSY